MFKKLFKRLLDFIAYVILGVFGLGIFTTINNSLFFSAIKITTIANAILTHYLAPIFVFIFGLFLLKEKITKFYILALVYLLLMSGLIWAKYTDYAF